VNSQQTRTVLESLYVQRPKQSFLKAWFNARYQRVVDFFAIPGRIELTMASTIVVLCLVAVIGTGVQLRRYTSPSFFVRPTTTPEVLSLTDSENPENQEPEDLLGLKQKDTDKDGLSDYDELYIYYTSPYLEDTDGDAVKDYDEIQQNTDPNCPKWRNCSYIPPSYPSYSEDKLYENVLTNADADFSALGFSEPPAELQGQANDLARWQVEQLTPTQLRELLSGAGLSQDILVNFSDEELIQMAAEVIATQQ